MYAIYHGPEGLRTIAHRLNYAAQLAGRIFEHYGFNLAASPKSESEFFDTITVTGCDAKKLE